MIYGSIRVHTGPCGPIWVARRETNYMTKRKQHYNETSPFQGDVRGIARAEYMSELFNPIPTGYNT